MIALGFLAAEATETSTRTPTVQARVFEKSNRLVGRIAFQQLLRSDLRRNPGIRLDVGYYWSESLGLELSGTGFFSTLDAAALDLRERYGALPDSQAPIARIVVGQRVAIAYGKMLIESLGHVVHFDFGGAIHVGTLITDVTFNVAGDAELSAQARLFEGFVVFTSIGTLVSYEARARSSWDAGALISVGVGVLPE